jgi:uncharacterized RDD family membrane protein YckC
MTADSDPASASKNAPAGYRYAGAWIRLAAFIIDNWVLAAVIVGLVFVRQAVVPHDWSLDHDLNGWAASVVATVLATCVYLGWFAGWQAAIGATPGMLLVGLRVRGPSGEGKPSLVAAVIRNSLLMLAQFVGTISRDTTIGTVLGIAGLVLIVAIGVSISKSPTCQGIHDRLAGGTYVLRRAPAPTSTL